MSRRLRGMYKSDGRDRILPKLSLVTFDHYRLAALTWALLVLFGALSYGVFLKREGFPSINIPYSIITGAYLVNDPAKVDSQVAKPISDVVLHQPSVKSVETMSRGAFFTVVIQYNEGVSAESQGKQIESAINQTAGLPKQARFQIESPRLGFTQRGDDAVVSLYDTSAAKTSEADMSAEANRLAAYIQQQCIVGVASVSIVDPFTSGISPQTGKTVATQTLFDRYGERQDGSNNFYPSVAVGVMQKKGSDVIKMDSGLRQAVDNYNSQNASSRYRAAVSASFAPDIKHEINELQRSLFEGLLAVLVVGSIIIAVRASLITVISMLTVLSVTVGILYVIGYSLNTITLFSLILCLGLVVDDTIIMVEALDAQRRRLTSPREIVRTATRKVSRAMVAATLTASLSFAPLVFVGGILGSFIRAIPITVITSLLVSLAIALIFIPLFARVILLGRRQIGARRVHEPAAAVESKIAGAIVRPMHWANHSRKRLVFVGLSAVMFGLGFIGAGLLLFKHVTFNIFPPSKDTDGLTLSLAFPPGTTLDKAQTVTDRADDIVAQQLGKNFTSASYFSAANDRTAAMRIELLPYEKRDIRSPLLRDQLQTAFQDFSGATVTVGQVDVGPPPSKFNVQIVTPDRQKSFRLANDLAQYLRQTALTRASGTVAHMTDVTVADPSAYNRSGGDLYVSVTAGFDATDTTTLVTLARNAVKKDFDAQKLASYGLPSSAIRYDLGQEQDNQNSFKSLALAFPVLLLAIFILLAVQFRSWLQPLLIFMAIPFSFFGITLGLYLSDNAFSFFAMLGFFALIGLSLKNTILLTDYANQLRRQGESPVEAAIGAVHERFRPLIATSLTAMVSLIPLALTSPFWEGLAVVLIGGLLSSTFLVVTVFPYYYLGAEFLRVKVGRAIWRAIRRKHQTD